MTGQKAPQFTTTNIDGEKLSLGQLVGRYDVVIVNFWGLRCGACIDEMPHLNDLHRKYGKKVKILGVNVDALDGGTLNKFIKKMKINIEYDVVPDPEFKMVEMFNMLAAPLTIVIDKGGNVRYTHENYVPGDEKELLSIVESVISGRNIVNK